MLEIPRKRRQDRRISQALDHATLGVGIASLAVLRILHGDVANLRERMATLEGTVDLPTGFPIDREAGRAAGGTDGE